MYYTCKREPIQTMYLVRKVTEVLNMRNNQFQKWIGKSYVWNCASS